MFSNSVKAGRSILLGTGLGLVTFSALLLGTTVPNDLERLRDNQVGSPPKALAQAGDPAQRWLSHSDHIGAAELRDSGAHSLRYDGTLVGNPTLVEMPDDWALHLDGVSQIAQMRPTPTPPFHGTIFIDPDILTGDDPTSFVSAAYAGRGMRTVYDRRAADWVSIEAYLFDLRFDDGLESEAIVNPEFGSEAAAERLASQYAEEVGRLPTALRREMDALWIHAGTEPFGGGNRSILIHTGQADAYIRDGILEETLIHEAAHTSLDADHAKAPGWLRAQERDGNFISAYARDNPLREDVAESFVPYLAERYRRDRISAELAETILRTIPNRMDYLDAQAFDLYPMVRGEDGGMIWLPVVHLGDGG